VCIGVTDGVFDLARPAFSDPQADYGRSGLGALVALGTAVVVSYGYFCYVPKLIITG
jgi:hypothetical protein